MEIKSLYIYPIKSLPWIQIDQTHYDKDGFAFDRIFGLYDLKGVMQTRRICPGMADFVLKIEENNLIVYSKLLERSIIISCFQKEGLELQLKVWDRVEVGYEASDLTNSFFTEHFRKPVRMYSIKKRIDSFASFHDDSPVLVCNEASVRYLELKTDVKIDIMRFRPNVILSGDLPFDEANWNGLSINNQNFESVKLCSRCIVINQKPITAMKDLNVLQLIKPYTSSLFKIKFGLYIRPSGSGTIHCLDRVTLI